MNQVNPLHIGGLLLTISIYLCFQLGAVKEGLREAKQEYATSEALAVDLSALKNVYANKKKVQSSLEHILRQPSLREAHLSVNRGDKFIKITSKEMSTRTLNIFMNKILNTSYNITAMKIKKLSERKASLKMEIQW